MRHGSVKRSTLFLASMDINTVDVTRPRRISKIMGDQDVRRWVVAAILREMTGLEGQNTFENVESKFSYARCIRQESVESPRL